MNDSSIFQAGDVVVGSSDPSKSIYSPSGAKIVEGGVKLFGDSQALKEHQKALVESAIGLGGKLVQTKTTNTDKKKKRGQKASKTRQATNNKTDNLNMMEWLQEEDFADQQEEVPVRKEQEETVQFENDFGRIRGKVECIVEHHLAYLLVFKNEDSVIFEPKTGESLKLYLPGSFHPVDVYYPGVTFDSPDGIKRFMILFKVPEENQE